MRSPVSGIRRIVAVCAAFACIAGTVRAESYLAVGGGVVLPNDLSNVTADENFLYPATPTPGFGLFEDSQISDLDLKRSDAVNVKLGHYLNAAPWLGFEFDYMHAECDFKRQNVDLTHPFFGTFTEDQLPAFINNNTYVFNTMLRYPGEIFQPFLGIGVGLLHNEIRGIGLSGILAGNDPSTGIQAPDFKTTTADVMFNLELGSRVLLTDRLFLYSEWKFNCAEIHANEFRSLSDIDASFSAHTFLTGIGYSFGRLPRR